jgi:hypothetical protein
MDNMARRRQKNEVIGASRSSKAQPLKLPAIVLPKPKADRRALSIFDAVRLRRTTREISERPLSRRAISDLLWFANGINRDVGPFGLTGRTAASASNSQEIDLYIALREGAYSYDARAHTLEPVIGADLRALTLTPGQLGSDAKAPLHLIYVVDLNRLTHTKGFQEPGLQDPEVQRSYYFVDTGLIAGNVYLFAAAHRLAAWFHNCDKANLAKQLNLRAEQRVLFAHSVGYPSSD